LYNIIKFFKNITLHIKLKNPHAGLLVNDENNIRIEDAITLSHQPSARNLTLVPGN
jgi:hypothetical protein